MIKVLVDHSVRRDALVGQWTTRPHGVLWGARSTSIDVTVLGRRPLPEVTQVDRIANIEALPTIRRLALEENLRLVTSRELDFEGWSGRSPGKGTKGDLLAGIVGECVDSPVERSFFRTTAKLEEAVNREYFRDYCAFLNDLTTEQAQSFIARLKNLPPESVRGLRDVTTYQRLCRHAAREHYPDLFHLWTAEQAGCSYFMTMERRLRNFVKTQCDGICRCRVVWPIELLDELGVPARDRMPFEVGDYLSFIEAVGGGEGGGVGG